MATILCPGDEPVRADIVFVHGLRGDAISTWKTGGICWPRDILNQHVKNVRIISWGYDSSIAHLKDFSSQASIFAHAENLVGDIMRCRIALHGNARPLIFVGHSLGGLVIKEALIRSFEYQSTGQDSNRGRIYASTKGVVFLGTPHRGSDRTQFANIIVAVAKVALRKPNDRLIRSLREDSEVLEKQRKTFASISKNMALMCFFEELPTGIGIIVPESSASMDGYNVITESIAKNHMDMCKFESADDPGFLKVAGTLEELISRPSQESGQLTEQLQLTYDYEEILTSLEFTSMNDRIEDPALDAHRETLSWVFESDSSEFLMWLREGHGIFWISGKAGSGKSTLMKSIFTDPRTEDYAKKNLQNAILAGFFFHERGSIPFLKSGTGLMRAILYQVLRQDPRLIPLVFPRDVTRSSRLRNDESTWSQSNLRKALRRLFQQTALQIEIVLMIDGLDEFSGDHDDLIDIVNEMQSSQSSASVSTKIRICVSSRPLRVFEEAFMNCKSWRMDELNYQDIKSYAESRLGEHGRLESMMQQHPASTFDLVEQIVKKAHGVFLWVSIVVKELINDLRNNASIKILEERLKQLPPGLNSLYEHLFQNIDNLYKTDASLAFQIVQHSFLPLTAVGLSFALEGEDSTSVVTQKEITDQEIQRRTNVLDAQVKGFCRGLLELAMPEDQAYIAPIKEVRFLHLTVSEFLRRPEQQSWLLTHFNDDLSIQGRLVNASIRQARDIRLFMGNNPHYTTWGDGFIRGFHASVFQNAIAHIQRKEAMTGKSQSKHLDELEAICDNGMAMADVYGSQIRHVHWSHARYNDWREPSHWHSDFMSYAVSLGLEHSVKEKILQGFMPLEKAGRPLLNYAVCEVPPWATSELEWDKINPRIVRTLLASGADPNQVPDDVSAMLPWYNNRNTKSPFINALWHAWRRFATDERTTGEQEKFYARYREDEEQQIVSRWLESIEALLEYGADVVKKDITEDETRWATNVTTISPLSLFNRAFEAIVGPKVDQVRQMIVDRGGTHFEKYEHFDVGYKGRLEQVAEPER